MKEQSAHTSVRYKIEASFDGEKLFDSDQPLRSWWRIVKFNWSRGYHRVVLTTNLRDFPKYLREALWRPS